MAFKETFTDLRARRRIPMRHFTERVGIHPSYIHAIEHDGLLPTPDKLELLASVFVEVAREQEAADPEADARKLREEHDRIELVDRLGFDPGLAEALLVVRTMDAEKRTNLMTPLRDALAVYAMLDDQERGGSARMVARIRAFLESHPEVGERNEIAAELATLVTEFLDSRVPDEASSEQAVEDDVPTSR
jgi:transcriptional regulator with XRE-family HTH domain